MNQLIEDVLIRGILESEEKEAEAEGGGKTLEDSNEYVYEEYFGSDEEMQQPPILDESEDRVGNDLQGPSMLGFRDLVLFLFLVQYLSAKQTCKSSCCSSVRPFVSVNVENSEPYD